MGITVDFLVKHVRPADGAAFQAICNRDGDFWGYLSNTLGMNDQQIEELFTGWAIVVDAGLTANTARPLAEAVSQARWDELYQTPASTILFLTDPLLRELSHWGGQNVNQTFDFRPYEHIPFAVTIYRDRRPSMVVQNANGAQLAADNQGNVVHFAGLIR